VPLLSVGVSYRGASVALLERLSFPIEDLPKAYHHLRGIDEVRGGVIVSTCNRVEVLAEIDSYHPGLQALRGFLGDSREVPMEELAGPLASHYEEDAVRHLFALASGIDSMVVGEPQILAQVREAFRSAEREGALSPLLDALFRRGIRVGRRARAETRIGANPGAMVEAGVSLAEEALGTLAGAHLVVVGAGTMAELAVRALTGRGVARVTVLNRTPSRAERLAGKAGAVAGPLEDLEQALALADVVVSMTGATGLVIERGPVERAAEGRRLFVLDLAVPRDVDPTVRELPGITLIDIDDLRTVVNGADGDEVERVRTIVEEEAHRFAEWRRAARLAPLIRALYDRAEQARRAELDKVEGRLTALTEDERAAVEAATSAIVKKLLHRPVVRAKELSEDDAEVRLLARLFDLDPPPPA
jgi:glutamyl-tRNA reductase